MHRKLAAAARDAVPSGTFPRTFAGSRSRIIAHARRNTKFDNDPSPTSNDVAKRRASPRERVLTAAGADESRNDARCDAAGAPEHELHRGRAVRAVGVLEAEVPLIPRTCSTESR
jgi:hypothetical protein